MKLVTRKESALNLLSLAQIYVDLEKLSKAKEALERCMALDPADVLQAGQRRVVADARARRLVDSRREHAALLVQHEHARRRRAPLDAVDGLVRQAAELERGAEHRARAARAEGRERGARARAGAPRRPSWRVAAWRKPAHIYVPPTSLKFRRT